MKNRVAILLLAAAIGGPTGLLSQSPAPSAVADFQADSNVVLVDVAVTDKKGNVPHDLTAQDFKILEDGKEQKITSFSFAGAEGRGRTGKHFVALVFEEDQPGFRDEALRFIDQFAGRISTSPSTREWTRRSIWPGLLRQTRLDSGPHSTKYRSLERAGVVATCLCWTESTK
jgi:hypothetical protein